MLSPASLWIRPSRKAANIIGTSYEDLVLCGRKHELRGKKRKEKGPTKDWEKRPGWESERSNCGPFMHAKRPGRDCRYHAQPSLLLFSIGLKTWAFWVLFSISGQDMSGVIQIWVRTGSFEVEASGNLFLHTFWEMV